LRRGFHEVRRRETHAARLRVQLDGRQGMLTRRQVSLANHSTGRLASDDVEAEVGIPGPGTQAVAVDRLQRQSDLERQPKSGLTPHLG
jgi:hypothetical protein